jgi:hypothetical protein
LGNDGTEQGRNTVAIGADQDRIEKFEISPSPAGDTYVLVLTTKSEEVELVADREMLQELADEIYEQLDKGEAKKV